MMSNIKNKLVNKNSFLMSIGVIAFISFIIININNRSEDNPIPQSTKTKTEKTQSKVKNKFKNMDAEALNQSAQSIILNADALIQKNSIEPVALTDDQKQIIAQKSKALEQKIEYLTQELNK